MSIHVAHLTQHEHRLLQFIKMKLNLNGLSDEELVSHLRKSDLSSIPGLLRREVKIIEKFLKNLPQDADQLICITDGESAVLYRLEKDARQKNLSTWDLIAQITIEEFREQPGVGKKKANLLASLKKKAPALAKASSPITPLVLLESPKSLEDAEKILLGQMESLLTTSDPTEQSIIKSKLGYSAPKKTLRDVAIELGLSESRCSQILTQIEQRLRFSKIFSDSYLETFSGENKFNNPKELFPVLSTKFSDTQGFVNFLKLVMNNEPVQPGPSNSAKDRELKKAVIYEVFSSHHFPMGLEAFHDAYVERTSTHLRDYWQALAKATDDGLIRIENHAIVWADLNLPATIANLLAESQEGLTVSELLKKLAQVIGKKVMNEYLLRACRENENVFQSSKNFFRHRKYFEASLDEIERVRNCISAHEVTIEDQPQDIFAYLAQHPEFSDIDPYTFAEIYRRLADEYKTNSLKFKNLSSVSRSDRKKQILALISSSEVGLTAAEIEEATGLAQSYVHRLLTELMNEIQITRTSKTKYQANTRILEGVDAEAIRNAIERTLSELGKIAEAGFLAAKLNQKLGIQVSKEIYLTIAKIPGNITIHVTRNLMSLQEIPFNSLHELVGACVTETSSDTEIIAAVRNLVHLTEDMTQSIRFQVLPSLRSATVGRPTNLKVS